MIFDTNWESKKLTQSEVLIQDIRGVHKQSPITLSLDKNIHLTYVLIVRNSSLTILIDHLHPQASSRIVCVCVGQEDTKVSLTLSSKLSKNETETQVDILSLLPDSSDIHVDAQVTIPKQVKNVSGHLHEKNILLGDKVKLRTLPMLDVRSHEVSASHGCQIDRISSQGLFYMTSKGISPSIAKKLIIQGLLHTLFPEDTEKQPILHSMQDAIMSDVLLYDKQSYT